MRASPASSGPWVRRGRGRGEVRLPPGPGLQERRPDLLSRAKRAEGLVSPALFHGSRPVPLPQFRILRQFPQKGTLRICLHLLQQAGDQGTLDLSGGLPGGQVPVEGRAAQVPGHRQAVEQPGPAGPEPSGRPASTPPAERVQTAPRSPTNPAPLRAHRRICQHLTRSRSPSSRAQSIMDSSVVWRL